MRQIIFIVFFLFVISLFIRLCYFLLNLVRLKQKVNKLGCKLCILPNLFESKKKFYVMALISYTIVAMCTLLLVFLTKEMLVLILMLFCITNVFSLLLLRKTSNYNGVYENGIILGTFIGWNKIAFWKQADDMNLVVQMKNGRNINLHIMGNKEEVIKLFLRKIILKE